MTNFVALPLEVREQIYQYYFKVDGGYVFNGDSEKLTTAGGNPIDLSLVYTCRSIANDTKDMPLAVNTITFSTVYREDWRELAGCFNYVSAFSRLLEADLVVRLARFMTPDMYSKLALKFPAFVSQIQKASRKHEERLGPADFMPHSEFSSDDEPTSDNESEASSSIPEWNIRIGHRAGHAFSWSGQMLDTRWPNDFYDGFGSIVSGYRRHPLRREWVGGFWAIQRAMSYCLRLLAEKEPAEFTRLVYEALPEWAGTYAAHEFLDLTFEPWAIPSRSEVAAATSRLEADNAWKLLERWYYTPLRAYNEFDRSSGSQKLTGTRCREKIRFSAAAAAIRFLKRRPVDQRLQIRNLTLHEDLPSVGCPSAHVQGLAPFFRENPRLRVKRHVSLLNCIEARFGEPQNVAWFLHHPTTHSGWNSIDTIRFPYRLAEWLLDALAVTDVGIPADAFTFILEGGPHADFCTDLFQQAVHRDIAWYKAYKACVDRDLVYFPPHFRYSLTDEGLEEAMEKLMDPTSFLRCDFNPGLPWDFEKLVEETKTLDHVEWERKLVHREPRKLDFPPTLPYADTLADNYEIQEEDEYACEERNELSA
ncbi:hypothetical protein ACJ41O_010433 [Fusarium nematophilum]